MSSNRLDLRLLSGGQLEQIEETTYRLLEEVGISLDYDKAREMLAGHGCHVRNNRVLIPRDTVHWALSNLKNDPVYRSADGAREFRLGDGQIRTHNSGGDPFTLDLYTGKRRQATVQDVADAARLLDALPNLDVVIPLYGPQDVPEQMLALASYRAVLDNTKKPCGGAAADKPEDVRYTLAMAKACCGGEEAFRKRPTISISVSPVSPLRFTQEGTAAIMAVAESGAPFHSLPAPSLGATSPITMAAALAQQHAEVLASFVIVAATKPGATVMYCSRISPIDLRTAVSTWGGPEIGLSGACATQLAHHIGFACDAYGLSTSSAKLDPQYGYECFNNAVIPALAGTDILSGIGGMESGLTASPVAAVIGDEMAGLIKHVVKGVAVDQETLAFDVMKDVILGGDVFLGQLHTVQQMRKGAIWVPSVSEREIGTSEDPEFGLIARATRRAKEIMATHKVEPLPDDVSRQLDEIMEDARRELVAG